MIDLVIEVLVILFLVAIFVAFIIVGAMLLVMVLRILRKINEIVGWMRWPKQLEKKKSRKRER